MSFLAGFVEALGDDAADRRKRSRDLEDKKAQREDDKLFYDFQLSKQYEWDRKKQEDEDKKDNKKKAESKKKTIEYLATVNGWDEKQKEFFSVQAEKYEVEQLDGLAEKMDIRQQGAGSTAGTIAGTQPITPGTVNEEMGQLLGATDGVSPDLSAEAAANVVTTGSTASPSSALFEFVPKTESDIVTIKSADKNNIDMLIAQAKVAGKKDLYENLVKTKEVFIEQELSEDLRTMDGGKPGIGTWTDENGEAQQAWGVYNNAGFRLPGQKSGVPYSALSPSFSITSEESGSLKPTEIIKIQEHLGVGVKMVLDAKSMFSDMGNILKMSREDPAAQTFAGALANASKTIVSEAKSFIGLANVINGDDGLTRFSEMMDAQMANLEKSGFSGNQKAITFKKIDFALKYLQSRKQTGNSVSDKDMKMVLDAVFDPNPDKLERLFIGIGQNIISNAEPAFNQSLDNAKDFDVGVSDLLKRGDLNDTLDSLFEGQSIDNSPGLELLTKMRRMGIERSEQGKIATDVELAPENGFVTGIEGEEIEPQVDLSKVRPVTEVPEGARSLGVKTLGGVEYELYNTPSGPVAIKKQ